MSDTLTLTEYRSLKKKKVSKYRNKRCEYGGIKFASKKEMRRYMVLKAEEDAGVITELKLQVKYDLQVCNYFADFQYYREGKLIVEDCKGFRTPVYRIKKKLMKKIFGIEILET